jgi:hypothetical protein
MALMLTSNEAAALVRDIVLIMFFAVAVIALMVGLLLGRGFYKRIKNLIGRVEAGIDRVEMMVDTVDSTASTVRSTATSMNRGMRAGGIARSAVTTVFGRGPRDSEETNGENENDD